MMQSVIIVVSDVLTILFMIASVLLSIACIYFLIRGIKKDMKNGSQVGDDFFQSINGLISKGQLQQELVKYLNATPNPLCTMFYIDIDDFKAMNDAFGQRQGDVILTSVAKNLLRILPRFSVMANFTGDDFIILVKGEFTGDRVQSFLGEIQQAVSKPVKIFDDEVSVTASIGVVSAPFNGKNPKILMSNLEVAMYVSKREGRNRYTIFDSDLSAKEANNASYYQQVKRAIAKNEFSLYYQPIVEIKTGELMGLEALIRWNHPEAGVVPPSKFLNILEQTGDINWVGLWSFESIVKLSVEWAKTFNNPLPFFSFNLSPKQLMSKTIVEDFKKALRKYRSEASHFCLEIIDFALFEKHGIVKENLLGLKGLGFKIAVDKFSLDYTELSRIEQYSIDIIKLDRKFASNVKDSSLNEQVTQMLAQYAKKENKIVVVEGLEDQESLQFFHSMGIEYGQGYYFSQPKPANEIIDAIKNAEYQKKAIAAKF